MRFINPPAFTAGSRHASYLRGARIIIIIALLLSSSFLFSNVSSFRGLKIKEVVIWILFIRSEVL
jgi:hypothetical protein